MNKNTFDCIELVHQEDLRDNVVTTQLIYTKYKVKVTLMYIIVTLTR
jgi:hypothetical protein